MKNNGNQIARSATKALTSIAGAAVGAALIVPFGPILGPVLGAAYSAAGEDILLRQLSPLERTRAEKTLALAQERANKIRVNGGMPRVDISQIELKELGEGILLAAKDSYEEKKIPLIANLMGGAPFTAMPIPNLIESLKMAQSLSFRDLCILSIIGQYEWAALPGAQPGFNLSNIPFRDEKGVHADEYTLGVYSDVKRLATQGLIYQLTPNKAHEGKWIAESMTLEADIVPARLRMQFKGRWLYNGMLLDTIDESELVAVKSALG